VLLPALLKSELLTLLPKSIMFLLELLSLPNKVKDLRKLGNIEKNTSKKEKLG
jgi:hypothetical protein